jgi:methyl-accepting chemotaxis protein
MNDRHHLKSLPFIFMVLFSVMLIASGCGESEEKTGMQDIKEKTSETAEAVKDYAGEQKSEFMDEANNALEDVNEQIDKLGKKIEANWDEMDQAARDQAEETLGALKEKQKTLSEELSK